MIDLNLQLNFSKKPCEKIRSHTVYPLSDQGFYEYISPKHFTHHYLSKFDPKIMDYVKRNSVDTEEAQVKPEKKKVVEKEKTRNSKNFNQKKETVNNNISVNENYVIESQTQAADHNKYNTEDNTNDKTLFDNYNNFKNRKQNSIRAKFFYSKGGSLPPEKRKILKPCTPEQINDNNNRFNKQYLNDLNKLKKTVVNWTSNSYISDCTTPNNITTDYPNFSRTKYDGFASYQVPRIDHLIQFDEKKRINATFGNFNNRIKHILDFERGDKNLNGNDDLISVCSKENEKFKNIIVNNLNNEFLTNSKLPRIAHVVNQPKLLFSRNNNGNSKMMGGKYNPYNYEAAKPKNMTKRNVFGALFNH